MPFQGGPSNGPAPSVAQLPVVKATLTLNGPFPQVSNSREVHADNLPGVNVWTRATGAGMTVQIQFADANNSGTISWLNLKPAYVSPVGVEILVNERLGSFRYRIQVTAPADGTLRYRITASLT